MSGSNVSLVGGAAVLLAAWGGAGRRVRAALALGAVVGFVVLARPEPSVLRAGAMGGLALFGLFVARGARGVPLLATAVVGLLLADPWLARSFGFVLSVLATGALLLLVPAWVERTPPHVPRWVVVGLAVPVAAFVVTAPVTVLLQPTVSLVAVPANLLTAPAVAPATVLGVAAAAVAPWWAGGAHLLALLGGLATAWIALVARTAASFPHASIPWPGGAVGAVLLGIVMVAVVVRLSRRSSRAGPGLWPVFRLRAATGLEPMRTGAGAAAGAATGAGAVTGAGVATGAGAGTGEWAPAAASGPPDVAAPAAVGWLGSRGRAGSGVRRRERARTHTRLRLGPSLLVVALVVGWLVAPRLPGVRGWPPPGWWAVQCDVGQGDALVVAGAAGHAVLVDTGPEPGPVDGCLRRLGVTHLDLVLLTHFHADHVGGLAGALRGRRVDSVLVSPFAEPSDGAAAVHRIAAAAHVPVVVGGAGMEGVAGAVGWRLVWPDANSPTPAGAAGEEGSGPNDASLVAVIASRGRTLVALGDVEPEAQRPLEARLAGVDADVVKVAHHGSSRQDPGLYRELRPEVALIGVGRDNDYGHPAPRTLALLAGQGLRVLRTDRDGDVAVVVPSGQGRDGGGPGLGVSARGVKG